MARVPSLCGPLAKGIVIMVDEENKEKELEQIDKQEVKEEKKEQGKRDSKLVIASVICTLLFIIILLLLVLLGLKKCSKGPDVGSSSSSEPSSNEPIYDYDDVKLNDVFKKIVYNQVYIDMGTEDPVDEILAVNYSDADNKFTLDIDARIGDKVYYYHASNVEYSNHETFVEHLLTLDTNQTLPIITTGEETSVAWLDKTEERLTNEVVGAHYVIFSSASPKYLSGFYFNNPSNEYYVYQKMELTNTDAFPSNSSIKIGLDSPLYRYYNEILNQ